MLYTFLNVHINSSAIAIAIRVSRTHISHKVYIYAFKIRQGKHNNTNNNMK